MLSQPELPLVDRLVDCPAAPTPTPVSNSDEALFERIDSLRREDETLYNILAVDVWALAKTMDEFQPGFWSEFMKNREQALRRFMSEVVKSKPSDLRRPPFLR
jgi:hypothetical protein